MKETEQTLLDQIKEEVASRKHGCSYGNVPSSFRILMLDEIAERYATAKAKASCEATLKKKKEFKPAQPTPNFPKGGTTLTESAYKEFEPVSAPSESQEEMWREVFNYRDFRPQHFLEIMQKEFTITRNP